MKAVRMGGCSPAPTTLTVVSQKGNAKHSFARAAYAALVLTSGALMGALHTRAEGLLVPPYTYPAGTGATQWNALATAAASVPTTAILNPNSGSGTTQGANYVAAVARVCATGGKMIGYVSNSYVNRPLSAVMQGINTYQVLYWVDGSFIDGMTIDSATTHVRFYQSVYNYIRGLSPNYTVTGNPGTNVLEIYANLSAADQLVIFEDSVRHYASYAPLAWQANYPMICFTHIVYAASAAQIQAFVRNTSGKGATAVFITSKTLSNPYGILSIYWSREVPVTAVTP